MSGSTPRSKRFDASVASPSRRAPRRTRRGSNHGALEQQSRRGLGDPQSGAAHDAGEPPPDRSRSAITSTSGSSARSACRRASRCARRRARGARGSRDRASRSRSNACSGWPSSNSTRLRGVDDVVDRTLAHGLEPARQLAARDGADPHAVRYDLRDVARAPGRVLDLEVEVDAVRPPARRAALCAAGGPARAERRPHLAREPDDAEPVGTVERSLDLEHRVGRRQQSVDRRAERQRRRVRARASSGRGCRRDRRTARARAPSTACPALSSPRILTLLDGDAARQRCPDGRERRDHAGVRRWARRTRRAARPDRPSTRHSDSLSALGCFVTSSTRATTTPG